MYKKFRNRIITLVLILLFLIGLVLIDLLLPNLRTYSFILWGIFFCFLVYKFVKNE
jgi:uncharacterized membrane protein YccC